MTKKEVEGSKIEISTTHMDMAMEIDFVLGSETRFLLSIGSTEESINPYFLHIWINTENLKKFIEQGQNALKEAETTLKRLYQIEKGEIKDE